VSGDKALLFYALDYLRERERCEKLQLELTLAWEQERITLTSKIRDWVRGDKMVNQSDRSSMSNRKSISTHPFIIDEYALRLTRL